MAASYAQSSVRHSNHGDPTARHLLIYAVWCLWRWSAARTLPPVYLQYDSHSKTIVGAVREDDGRTFILCLDPAKNPSSALQDGHVRTVKLSAADLDCQAYQIVHVLIGKSMSVEQWTFARNPNNGNMKC